MKSIYILHEGNAKKTNDNELIKLLLEHLKTQYPELKIEKVEFHGMGTKSNFFKLEQYPPLVKQGVETGQIDKVLFIVDADNEKNDKVNCGFNNTENGLNQIIAKLNFQAVSSIYIMCDPITKKGYLESLILSTIPEQQRNCIECFLACSEFKSKEHHKAIFNDIYKHAYPKAPFDFRHENFSELKQKLINLF